MKAASAKLFLPLHKEFKVGRPSEEWDHPEVVIIVAVISGSPAAYGDEMGIDSSESRMSERCWTPVRIRTSPPLPDLAPRGLEQG